MATFSSSNNFTAFPLLLIYRQPLFLTFVLLNKQ